MRSPVLERIINTALFYFGWLLSINEAAVGKPFYGLMVVLSIICYHLYRSQYRLADLGLLLIVLVCGPLTDVFYASVGLLEYQCQMTHLAWVPPYWIFFLWGLFAVNVPLFAWLRHRRLLCMLFGAIGAPVSYMSAIRLGCATMLLPIPWFFLIVGGIWAVFLPSVIGLSHWLRESNWKETKGT